MSDVAAVLVALSTAAGAWASRPFPVGVAALVVAAGLALRRPAVLAVGLALAASGLGARSWAGVHPPVLGSWTGVATLVGDPEPVAGAVRVVARVGGKHVEVWARGGGGRALADRLAGERVALAGRIEALSPVVRSRLARSHVAARMTASRVGGWTPGDPASRLANGIRHTLVSGVASLPPDRRALFAGFVLGDGRDESPEVTDDFRASGLAHLLVVSGENVAFVLALVAPLLGRLSLRGRLVAGLAVLALFGVLTRWEPSVLRAEAMAALALLAATLGRPASTVRLLALAVTGLLLVDPLLVGSVGFLLSVGACTGIALLAGRIAAALPGPRLLASATAVTLAAQVGVAPVILPVFGSLPVAALPANLLAVPAAGPLTAWGMAAGIPAGLVGGSVARLLHLPTGLLLAWVAGVARHAAAAPLGQLRAPHLLVLGGALVVAALPGVRRGGRWLAVAVAGVAVAAAVPVLRPPPLDAKAVAPGLRLWRRSGATVLVVDDVRSGPALLAGLHRVGVRRLDLVAVTRPGPAVARVVVPVLSRFPARLVLAPAGSTLPGAVVPAPGTAVAVGPFSVEVAAAAPRLAVEVGGVGAGPGAAAADPPFR